VVDTEQDGWTVPREIPGETVTTYRACDIPKTLPFRFERLWVTVWWTVDISTDWVGGRFHLPPPPVGHGGDSPPTVPRHLPQRGLSPWPFASSPTGYAASFSVFGGANAGR